MSTRPPSLRAPLPSVILLVLGLTFVSSSRREREPIRNTEQGQVKGTRYTLRGGKSVDCYLGIPFAKPPVGHLRFRHPLSLERRQGIYNATRFPNSCYQGRDDTYGEFRGSNMWNPKTPVSEDCLYLNIWVPHTQTRLKKSAVLVWIYGGGFYSGTTSLTLYDGKILASRNEVIVVSINYRVGVFGFLSLKHPGAPGNAGMFDQLMGLEWVQKNIHYFGGDPNNVTIFGESAGSVSVSLHLLSPLSQSNFQRAIMQSGTANMDWATATAEEGMRRSLDLATTALCNDKSDPSHEEIDEILRCLREYSPQRLEEQQWVTRGVLQFPFLPIIDGVFLVESPAASLRNKTFKRCPIVIGTNKNEGSWFIMYELDDYLDLTRKIMGPEEFVKSTKELFHSYPQYPQLNTDLGIESILFQYTDFEDPANVEKNLAALDAAVSDCHFYCFVNQFARAYADAGENVYMYMFNQRYTSNPWPEWMGVLHGDEILFMFGEPFKVVANYSSDERRLSSNMMTYWSNFAKTGNPNRRPGHRSTNHWPPYTPRGREYLKLSVAMMNEGNRSRTIGHGLKSAECVFWDRYLPRVVAATAPREPPVVIPPPTQPPAPDCLPVVIDTSQGVLSAKLSGPLALLSFVLVLLLIPRH